MTDKNKGKRGDSGYTEKVQKQKPRCWRGFNAILSPLGNNIDFLAVLQVISNILSIFCLQTGEFTVYFTN